MSSKKDYYEILGVKNDATKDEIRKLNNFYLYIK